MRLKKKLGLGMASAALGISLVGGGTFAYFNDTEAIANSFAAGTLDLSVVNLGEDSTELIKLANLKPGDTMEREFQLKNVGSLSIKEVLMQLSYSGFASGVDNGLLVDDSGDATIDSDEGVGANSSALKYLDQFVVDIFTTGTEGQSFDLLESTEQNQVTLADVYKATNANYAKDDKAAAVSKVKAAMTADGVAKYWVEEDGNGRINIASNNGGDWSEYDGLPADPRDFDNVHFVIEFKDSGSPQNQFQGNSVNLSIDLEARQWEGINSLTNDYTDSENEKAHPQDEAAE
ncbi:hypothetical protein A6P54_12900 [Bacillus sp. MKU004]|nr:hypothetical protein A6P54_12900 [Bacillus sp. MKU004]